MMKKAVIFDMDGTLWDSADNIATSWNDALDSLGITDVRLTRERITALMGCTMDRFAREILPGYEPDRRMEILHILEERENDYLREHGAVLLGNVEGTFRALKEKGCFVGIVSNSQAGYIEAFLDYYGLADLVDDRLSYGDTQKGKAENLRLLIGRNALTDFCYVGDTAGDYDACREAGVPFVWASYGFGSVDAEVPRITALEEIVSLIPG